MRTRRFTPPQRVMRTLWTLSGLGALTFVAGLFIAPERVWGGYLLGFTYLTMLGLSGVLFLALLTLASAKWSAALRRIPEAMTAAIPAAGLLGLILLFGLHSLYEWSHAAVVENDPLLQHKSGWLNSFGFGTRLAVSFVLWTWFAMRFVSQSQRRDETGHGWSRPRALREAAIFMAVFAITFGMCSIDWLMSLEPHWFSTMFPLEQVAGMASAGLAAAILLAVWLERQGPLRGVLRPEHLHDMGRLLFAFTLVWVYCWYCEYMLIWYTDIPEETTHFIARQQGPWWLLMQSAVVLKWLVPFLALLVRRSCRSRTVLVRVAIAVLVGQALDLYVQIGPPLMGDQPVFGLWELLPLVGALALFGVVTLRALADAPVVPENDPDLPESLAYHTT